MENECVNVGVEEGGGLSARLASPNAALFVHYCTTYSSLSIHRPSVSQVLLMLYSKCQQCILKKSNNIFSQKNPSYLLDYTGWALLLEVSPKAFIEQGSENKTPAQSLTLDIIMLDIIKNILYPSLHM